MSPASKLDQYVNTEYNNGHHNLKSTGKISTFKDSSVSTLTSPSVTPTNYEWCSIFSPIHDKINYSYWSNSQPRAVSHTRYVMKS